MVDDGVPLMNPEELRKLADAAPGSFARLRRAVDRLRDIAAEMDRPCRGTVLYGRSCLTKKTVMRQRRKWAKMIYAIAFDMAKEIER